jgi:hypothetical protein
MPIAGGGRSPRAGGRIQIVGPKRPLSETVEAAERPPQPNDPRPAVFRNVPPFGGAAWSQAASESRKRPRLVKPTMTVSIQYCERVACLTEA